MEKGKDKLEGIYFTYINKYLKWLKNEKEDLSKIKISQHTKKAKISVTSNLAKDIQLKIVATPDDWIRLAERYDPEALGIGIEYRFILPVLFGLWPLKKPRGRTKTINQLTGDQFKAEVSHLYLFVSYWCKKSFRNWPECLKRLVDRARANGYDSFIKAKKGYSALAITTYCLEQTWGKFPSWKNICSVDGMDNLYQTYIYDNGRLNVIKNTLLTDTILRDKNLPTKDPFLSSIFNKLRLI